MIKFQKIGHFSDMFKAVKKEKTFVEYIPETKEVITKPLDPENSLVIVHLSTKLHGTNAGICLDRDRGLIIQSREREITPESDNAGFAAYMSIPNVREYFESKLKEFVAQPHVRDGYQSVVLYGEWCGQGVQKGVACSMVPKFFAPFACTLVLKSGSTINLEFWKRFRNEEVRSFPVNEFTMALDISNPQPFVDEINKLVEEIENEDPFMLQNFQVSGIGEGLVGYIEGVPNGLRNDYRFKAKGEKHKVRGDKTPVSIDPVHLESIDQLIEYTVTDARIEQGIQKLQEMGNPIDRKSTGAFMSWLVGDIFEEEGERIQEMVTKGIDAGLIKQRLGKVAVSKFHAKLDQL